MSDKRPKRSSTPPDQLAHRWYFREWCEHLAKRQADVERDLSWSRGKTSDQWHGRQRYTQNDVDEVAAWLQLEPYELLMPPDEALALRMMRDAARSIVANDPPATAAERRRAFKHDPTADKPKRRA